MNTSPDLPILEEVGTELNRLFVAQEQPRPRCGTRRWMRARVLLPLVGLVVTGSAVAATVTLTGGAKPIPYPGGGKICPPGNYFNYANPQTGIVYPFNYPSFRGTGLTAHSAYRCFTSERAAIKVGYKPARTPHGYTLVNGVYFGKASAFVRATCAKAQQRTPAAMFCPSTLPAPWQDQSSGRGFTDALDCPAKGCEEPILAINGGFVGPAGYVGTGDGLGAVSLWAISAAQQSAPATIGLVGCPNAKLNRRTLFRGHPAGWYTCADHTDLVETNSLLQWTIGQEHYGLMVAGPPGVRKRLTQYIAAHLVKLKPKA